jgi:hypothetical protein
VLKIAPRRSLPPVAGFHCSPEKTKMKKKSEILQSEITHFLNIILFANWTNLMAKKKSK